MSQNKTKPASTQATDYIKSLKDLDIKVLRHMIANAYEKGDYRATA